MTDTFRMTKQGVRDLNARGPKAKDTAAEPAPEGTEAAPEPVRPSTTVAAPDAVELTNARDG
jgi:hypothetical protein